MSQKRRLTDLTETTLLSLVHSQRFSQDNGNGSRPKRQMTETAEPVISSNCKALDALLGAGFKKGKIYQVSGIYYGQRSNFMLNAVYNTLRMNEKCLLLNSEFELPLENLESFKNPVDSPEIDEIRIKSNSVAQVIQCLNKVSSLSTDYRLLIINDFATIIANEVNQIKQHLLQNQEVVRSINDKILERRKFGDGYRLSTNERILKYNRKKAIFKQKGLSSQESLNVQRDEIITNLMSCIKNYLLKNRNCSVLLVGSLGSKKVTSSLTKYHGGGSPISDTAEVASYITANTNDGSYHGLENTSHNPDYSLLNSEQADTSITLESSPLSQQSTNNPVLSQMTASGAVETFKFASLIGNNPLWLDFLEAKITLYKNWIFKPDDSLFISQYIHRNIVDQYVGLYTADWALVERKDEFCESKSFAKEFADGDGDEVIKIDINQATEDCHPKKSHCVFLTSIDGEMFDLKKEYVNRILHYEISTKTIREDHPAENVNVSPISANVSSLSMVRTNSGSDTSCEEDGPIEIPDSQGYDDEDCKIEVTHDKFSCILKKVERRLEAEELFRIIE